MKKTSIILILSAFFVLLILNVNVMMNSDRNEGSSDLTLSLLFKTAQADGENDGDACVVVWFHPKESKLCDGAVYCYNDDGMCGLQRCCVYDRNGGPCQEVVCAY